MTTIPTKADRALDGDPPEVVVDQKGKKTFVRGKFLGKGGFAYCYEMKDKQTNKVYAGKVVSKAALVKSHQKQKIAQEIQIHRSLENKHVVGFHSYFEDDSNVYIILELCSGGSLMEMHRRRKTLTEAEARYFLYQILLGCRYLVQQRVIHRDLKLGNLLLNERMELKIGDFGFATRIEFEGERKMTLCGTPNYIAPEILSKKGHSFEVDVWSVGCILFTLLVGHPPFETPTLKETLVRIKTNKYHVPSDMSSPARTLIRRMLQPDPQRRPNIDSLLQDEFLTCGPLPLLLSTSSLTTEPRFDNLNTTGREPLHERNTGPGGSHGVVPVPLNGGARPKASQQGAHLSEIRRLLTLLTDLKPREHLFAPADEAEDPASAPVFWISKWADYTDKYGFGYQLCDNSIGVLFNDSTRMVLLSNKVSMMYVDPSFLERFCSLKKYPAGLENKVMQLEHLCNYMQQYLQATGEDVAPRESDSLSSLPYLSFWHRTQSAISFCLTNGTVQINFFHGHTKLILCPKRAAVSYIDNNKAFHTYRFQTLQTLGCPGDLLSHLKYARTIVEMLVNSS
ncbi:serine/threonine-protein kinase PLK1-like [Haemaphysalis longicornis]